MNLQTLKDLERHLTEAIGKDSALDRSLYEALVRDNTCEFIPMERYTSSLDAAIGLCERVLPDQQAVIQAGGTHDGKAVINAATVHGHGIFQSGYSDHSPALALCLATVRALIAKEEANG